MCPRDWIFEKRLHEAIERVVLDPNGKRYIRVLSRPALTLWEHRQAMDRLRAKGRSQIDETLLFSMVSQMHEITKMAQL